MGYVYVIRCDWSRYVVLFYLVTISPVFGCLIERNNKKNKNWIQMSNISEHLDLRFQSVIRVTHNSFRFKSYGFLRTTKCKLKEKWKWIILHISTSSKRAHNNWFKRLGGWPAWIRTCPLIWCWWWYGWPVCTDVGNNISLSQSYIFHFPSKNTISTAHTYHITTQCIVSNRNALTFTSIASYRHFICIVGTHFIFILTRNNIYFLNKMDKFLLEDVADDDEKTFTRTNKRLEYNRFIYYRIIIKFILPISFQIVNWQCSAVCGIREWASHNIKPSSTSIKLNYFQRRIYCHLSWMEIIAQWFIASQEIKHWILTSFNR